MKRFKRLLQFNQQAAFLYLGRWQEIHLGSLLLKGEKYTQNSIAGRILPLSIVRDTNIKVFHPGVKQQL